MKLITSLIAFVVITISPATYATESVNCGNETYWLQLHRNISTDEYAGFTLHKDGEILSFEGVSIRRNLFSPIQREIYFEVDVQSGLIRSIRLTAKGNDGILTINSESYNVTCDWSTYDI